MNISVGPLKDKVEFFEADHIKKLEDAIQQKIEINEAIMLEVYQVQHHVYYHPEHGRPVFTASVHFKAAGSL